MRFRWPADQSLQPQLPQIIGHLAGCVLGDGNTQQVHHQRPQIAIVETINEMRKSYNPKNKVLAILPFLAETRAVKTIFRPSWFGVFSCGRKKL